MDFVDYSLLGLALIAGLFYTHKRKSSKWLVISLIVIAEQFFSYYWYDLVVIFNFPAFIDSTVQVAIYSIVFIIVGNMMIKLSYFSQILYFTACFIADSHCYRAESCGLSNWLADVGLVYAYYFAWILIIFGLVIGDDSGAKFRNFRMLCRDTYNILHSKSTRVFQRAKKRHKKMV